MALKDEDTLMKRKKELEEAMKNLGLSFGEEQQEEPDLLAEQFQFDEEALKELTESKDERR